MESSPPKERRESSDSETSAPVIRTNVAASS